MCMCVGVFFSLRLDARALASDVDARVRGGRGAKTRSDWLAGWARGRGGSEGR